MAVATEITCIKCLLPKVEYHSPVLAPPRICSQCNKDSAHDAKREHLIRQTKKPIEQRLQDLEEFMYDHKLVQHGYQSAPRF